MPLHPSTTASPRSRARPSRGERIGGLFFLLSIPLGIAWMAGSLLSVRLGYAPALDRLLHVHPWTAVFFLPPVLLLPGAITGGIITSRARRRGLAELIAARGQLCPNCRYPLTAPSPTSPARAEGRCAECGHPYDPFTLKRAWCRSYPHLAYEIDWPAAPPAAQTPPPSEPRS